MFGIVSYPKHRRGRHEHLHQRFLVVGQSESFEEGSALSECTLSKSWIAVDRGAIAAGYHELIGDPHQCIELRYRGTEERVSQCAGELTEVHVALLPHQHVQVEIVLEGRLAMQ
jgi:hypothetical protein